MSEMDLLETFAYNLDYIMRLKNINQSELARMSGLSQSAINKYLNANRMPNLKAIVNICYALNCSTEDIIAPISSLVRV